MTSMASSLFKSSDFLSKKMSKLIKNIYFLEFLDFEKMIIFFEKMKNRKKNDKSRNKIWIA